MQEIYSATYENPDHIWLRGFFTSSTTSQATGREYLRRSRLRGKDRDPDMNEKVIPAQLEASKREIGPFGGGIAFDSGLQVLSAENGYGKSLAVAGIAWCLGLEKMFGLQSNDTSCFPLAVRDGLKLGDALLQLLFAFSELLGALFDPLLKIEIEPLQLPGFAM